MKKLLLRLASLAALTLLLPVLALPRPEPRTEPSDPPEVPSSISAPAETVEDAVLPAYYRVHETSSDRILKVSPAEYLKGTAAAELPASFTAETVIAQMVASHSYALTVLAAADPPVISDDPARHQGYLTEEERRSLYGDTFPARETLLDAAAAEALPWLLTSDGESILPAVFHSCSSGNTESAENVWGRAVPCLSAVESPGDLTAPGYRQEFAFPMQEAMDILAQNFPDCDPSIGITVKDVSSSGTVLTVSAGDFSCTGQELRRAFSLPSACFTITETADTLTFTTLGRGHGVGMSQYGAEVMALAGSSWQEILAHYYPGSVLVKISLQDAPI